jgi:hypothetical protein
MLGAYFRRVQQCLLQSIHARQATDRAFDVMQWGQADAELLGLLALAPAAGECVQLLRA